MTALRIRRRPGKTNFREGSRPVRALHRHIDRGLLQTAAELGGSHALQQPGLQNLEGIRLFRSFREPRMPICCWDQTGPVSEQHHGGERLRPKRMKPHQIPQAGWSALGDCGCTRAGILSGEITPVGRAGFRICHPVDLWRFTGCPPEAQKRGILGQHSHRPSPRSPDRRAASPVKLTREVRRRTE